MSTGYTPSGCAICGGSDIEPRYLTSRDYISGITFHLSRCTSCGSLQTNVHSTSNTHDYYGTEYYNSEKGKFSHFLERIFRLNHVRNARALHHRFPAKRVLEVGCGRGYLLSELKNLGVTVRCLESESAAEWILNNPDIPVSTLLDTEESAWPFEDQVFDLVIFWHVLEHLPDPVTSLKEAFRCLAPGGSLYVSMPNISSLQARMHPATWFHLDVPRHLHHFSEQGLTSALTGTGFTAVRKTPGDRMQNLFGWLQSIANLFTPRHINAIYRLLQGGEPLRHIDPVSLLIQLLTSWISLPLGLLGFFIEELLRNYGTITVQAEKTAFSTEQYNTTQTR